MKKIGDYLIEENICKEADIVDALKRQVALREKDIFKPLGEILVDDIGVAAEKMDHCLNKMHVDILGNTTIFKGMTYKSLKKTASIAAQQVLPKDKIIFNKDDEADAFFVVITGKVKVFIESEGNVENILAILGPGSGFGEMALLTGGPRSASVKTIETTSLLVLSKNYFDQLCDLNPDISRSFIKILSERLTHGNDEILVSAENERAYQRFVSRQTKISVYPLVGKSRAIKKVIHQIDEAAANSRPVLIASEAGTLKLALAKSIHTKSVYADGPFLSMNAKSANMDVFSDSQADTAQHDVLQLELAQSAILFGNEPGALSFAKTKRLGLLQICREGTVVIQNIDNLTPNIQERLLEYLNTGTFHTMGGSGSIHSSARIIATTQKKLKDQIALYLPDL